jgi:hypothetical protein
VFLGNVDQLSQTTGHYVPNERTFCNHCCENYKALKLYCTSNSVFGPGSKVLQNFMFCE